MKHYTIGLDYGSNSVRCILVDVKNGKELIADVFGYPTGKMGIMLDMADHNIARQNPQDYINGLETTVKNVIKAAKKADKDFDSSKVIGIGVDTTGSTPIPVDEHGVPLGMRDQFKKNLNAMSWLWKDHTGYAEAAEITALAKKIRPQYLAKCGGTYSSEWFFSKILHCLRVDGKVFDVAYTWVEHADYMTGLLTGTGNPKLIKRCRCAAGHKAMFNDSWGGYPDKEFLSKLDPKLGNFRDTLSDKTYAIGTAAGNLTKEWAQKLGLPEGIPVAMGAFDAHLGAVGSGIRSGSLVKIIGTSTCDMVVASNSEKLPDIPGICGIVDGSILPDFLGLEAGQSAVGDIFNWFVNYIQPGGKEAGDHIALTEKAAKLKPGQSGLLALDWNNGNRTILVDQRLTGLLLGQTLHTKPEEIYRSLIEATAFGALTIINRFEEYGVKINEVINCGGIAEKNSMLMQIYADVTGREMKVSRSTQTCALGSAIAAAVVAGKENGGYDNFADAQKAMTGVKGKTYKPIKQNHIVYSKLYKLYRQVHDAFGTEAYSGKLYNVMKDLLEIKESSRD
ncbi:MAG: Ribulokinase [Parcubacteria group bacterium GW2011_GWA2_43_17]|nr:MAG: Ribulokinase [Parcubacteria group bacterium GW2011_GWA2_43_17]KKT91164.1 MAG: Ribulokinase [Parcubacteria group bacterium GW2011_GWF2_45_11]OHB45254.1 MAG: ribulokinase [Planctomycetes bacterium GWC2_45_44]HBR20553.1 ribulokinase [Phycisphaerales bacterium]